MRCGSLLSLFCAAALAACNRDPVRYRYVVLISLDTVRADHIGCYGYELGATPNIDRLAAEGVRFERAITAAPTTLASHASLMTGTYPHRHGVPRNGFVLSDENTTLAERLKEHEFTTAAFVGSYALASPFGLKQGFDVYDEKFETEVGRSGVYQSQRSARAVTQAALKWFEEADPDRAFVFLHYFDAHAPYAPENSLSPPVGLDALSRRAKMHQSRWMSNPPGWEAPLSSGLPAELVGAVDGSKLDLDDDVIVSQYHREISNLDAALAPLFEFFRDPERARDTLIVLTADHGESFYEHADFFNHGLWLHDSTVHVPLIVHAPGLDARRVAPTVSSVDVAPTVLDLLELPRAGGLDGRTLGPLVRGAALERGPVFSEATQPTHPSFESGEWANARKPRCIVDGRWKLIRAPYLAREQLFDIELDPGERKDLIGSRDHEVVATLATLRERLDEWDGSAKPLASHYERTEAAAVARKLKELGYVEGVGR